MGNELVKKESSIEIWGKDHFNLVHEMYAPETNKTEYLVFRQLAQSLGADPRKKEIFTTIYSKNDPIKRKMSIVLSRDFYKRKAQEQQDYNGHDSQSVYENDFFEVENGVYKHKWTHKERGVLIAAYFLGWRKGIDRTFSSYVTLKEYKSKNAGLWQDKEETMLKKVAEAQGFRQMYTGLYGSAYSEDENLLIENDNNNNVLPDRAKSKYDQEIAEADIENKKPEPEKKDKKQGDLFKQPENGTYAERLENIMVAEFASDPEGWKVFLKEHSSFTNKEGKEITGKENIKDLSLERQKVTYGKISEFLKKK